MSNLSYRCYILPTVGMISYLFFALPSVNVVFQDWIPDYYYAIVMKSLLILIILFVTCRIMDIIWSDPCHNTTCNSSQNIESIEMVTFQETSDLEKLDSEEI